MSIHIGAAPGDFAETVLLPGDPLRASWAAETFLEAPRLINEVRGMLGYTGTWNGHPVTIHGSGMGMPTLSIYVNEMIRDFGVKQVIRIGSCGGMAPHVALRDVVIAMTASSVSTPSKASLAPLNYAPSADWGLLKAATDAAPEAKVGMIYSSDCFYEERKDIAETLIRHGCLAVEMETAELYTLAARHGARALSVCTVSDHIVTGASLPSEDRERSFEDMVEIALKAAFA
ncbi:MAG: purine-nucleoside phosphorylase [Pseudomonadota bacterium]